MRIIRRISAVIIGITFFIAGILKLMDPVGAGLVVTEYLKFFHLAFLGFASGFIAVSLALFETIIGAALITGVFRKITSVVSLCFIGVFTVITLILFIFNPNMDCGCFGEFIHLSHLQTLLKNVAMIVLWFVAFIPMNKIEQGRKIKYVGFYLSCISVCLFMVYSLRSIPLMDFTDLKAGTELFEAGTYLSFSDENGEYFDELAHEDDVLIISVYDPSKLDKEDWTKIEATLKGASDFTPLLLLSNNYEGLSPELNAFTYFADRKTLITLNRSNGGATYIAEGQIIGKWAKRKLPSSESLSEVSSLEIAEALIDLNNASHLKMQGFLIYVFAVMLLL